MIPLLEHPLIRKYFGCHCQPEANTTEGSYHFKNCTEEPMAYRVIQAMSERINKGDKYLALWEDATVEEKVSTSDSFLEKKFHMWALRLPDQFQTRRDKTCCCVGIHDCANCHGAPNEKPDPVEEKIKELLKPRKIDGFCWNDYEKELRELVSLARAK